MLRLHCTVLLLSANLAHAALDLQLRDEPAVPAQVISPIFQRYVAPLPEAADGAELAPLPVPGLQLPSSQPYQSPPLFCVNRDAGEASGAGLRWSINAGFGLYVQGRDFRRAQRLLKHSHEVGVCLPGSANPLCQSMPRQTCN